MGKETQAKMHTNWKSALSSGLAIVVTLIPGVGDALHAAGGPAGVAAAVGVIATATHSLIHLFTGRGETEAPATV